MAVADVFVSYAREDRHRAKALAEFLVTQGLSVWWDREIPFGGFIDKEIRQQLDDARFVIVLWSRASVQSNWVLSEAARGLCRGILIPVLIEKVGLPLEFARFQTANLIDWDGTGIHSTLGDLAAQIQRSLTPAGVPAARRPVEDAAGPPAMGAPPVVGQVAPERASAPLVADRVTAAALSDLPCSSPTCRSSDVELTDAVRIDSVEEDAEGWSSRGVIQLEYCVHGRCRTCGRIFEAAKTRIPILLPELACVTCQKADYLRYRVDALTRDAGGWRFSVAIRCTYCNDAGVLTKVLQGLLNIVGIDIGREGIRTTQQL